MAHAQQAPWRRIQIGLRVSAWLLACSLAVTAGCSDQADRSEPITVFAASSLTDSFRALEAAYEAAHPGDDVRLSFAGSQVLRLQIAQGAPTDVFASANPAHIQSLIEAGRMAQSRSFAHNRLTLIVPEDNPAGVTSFAELTKSRRLVVGTRNVPIGAYTDALLTKASATLGAQFERVVRSHIVSRESNVRLVRAKVELGEADAAIVYGTDARRARVRSIPIPATLSPAVEYRIGAVLDGPNPAAAERWLAFVSSAAGQKLLAEHGFVTRR